MLDGTGDQVGARKSGSKKHTLHGHVVGLSAAAGKDDLAGFGTEQVSDLVPGTVHGLASLPPLGIQARRIAPKLIKVRPHGL
jgi:hypothetical protein